MRIVAMVVMLVSSSAFAKGTVLLRASAGRYTYSPGIVKFKSPNREQGLALATKIADGAKSAVKVSRGLFGTIKVKFKNESNYINNKIQLDVERAKQIVHDSNQ